MRQKRSQMDRQAGPLPIKKQRFNNSICFRNAEGFCHTKTSIICRSHITWANSHGGRIEIESDVLLLLQRSCTKLLNTEVSPQEQESTRRVFFPPTSVYFKTIAGVGYLLKWAQYEHFLSRCLQQPLSQMNLHKATTTRENHNSLISDGLFRMTLGKGIKRKETNEDVKLELNAAVYPVTAAQLFKH